MQANVSESVRVGSEEIVDVRKIVHPVGMPVVDVAKVVKAVVEVVDVTGGGRFGKFLSITAWEATRPRRGRVA